MFQVLLPFRGYNHCAVHGLMEFQNHTGIFFLCTYQSILQPSSLSSVPSHRHQMTGSNLYVHLLHPLHCCTNKRQNVLVCLSYQNQIYHKWSTGVNKIYKCAQCQQMPNLRRNIPTSNQRQQTVQKQLHLCHCLLIRTQLYYTTWPAALSEESIQPKMWPRIHLNTDIYSLLATIIWGHHTQ